MKATLIDILNGCGWTAYLALIVFLAGIAWGISIHRGRKRPGHYGAYFVIAVVPFLLGILGFSMNAVEAAGIYGWGSMGFQTDIYLRDLAGYLPGVSISTVLTILLLMVGAFLLVIRRENDIS